MILRYQKIRKIWYRFEFFSSPQIQYNSLLVGRKPMALHTHRSTEGHTFFQNHFVTTKNDPGSRLIHLVYEAMYALPSSGWTGGQTCPQRDDKLWFQIYSIEYQSITIQFHDTWDILFRNFFKFLNPRGKEKFEKISSRKKKSSFSILRH